MKKILSFILKDWNLKAISILVALGIFVSNQYLNMHEQDLKIQLLVILPDNLATVGKIPKTIDIHTRSFKNLKSLKDRISAKS